MVEIWSILYPHREEKHDECLGESKAPAAAVGLTDSVIVQSQSPDSPSANRVAAGGTQRASELLV